MEIPAGLVWRSGFLPLSGFAAKYGGDALWALLVFCGCAFLFPRESSRRVALIALGLAWAVEFSQLYHAAWIDSIRSTRMGGLVLGSTYNSPDLVAYLAGIGLGVVLDHFFCRRDIRRTDEHPRSDAV